MLTLAEYLRELKLMEQQYGQEEELYPLVYMLLWESLKGKQFSVRVIEKGRGEKKVKNVLTGDVLPGNNTINYLLQENQKAKRICPDMAILDECFNKEDNLKRELLRGCIEVKGIFADKGKKVFELFDSAQYDDDIVTQMHWCYKDTDLKKYKRILYVNDVADPDITEFTCELLWYGKVLYTNGFRWKYIELVDNQKTIKVRCIDLGCLSKPQDWKELVKDDEFKKWEMANREEWNRLKNNLGLIKWDESNDNINFERGKNANKTNTP